MHRGKTSGNNVVAPTGDNSNRAPRELARRERFLNIFKVEQSNDLRFREVTVRVRYGCSPATVLRGSATFNLVSHCQLKVCMYRAIKKALPLSVCETDTTTVVEVDKGQRFITSVNYVLLIRSSYRSRIANIRIHFEFAKKNHSNICVPKYFFTRLLLVSAYFGSISYPTNRRPSLAAIAHSVPLPAKGTTTSAPGRVVT